MNTPDRFDIPSEYECKLQKPYQNILNLSTYFEPFTNILETNEKQNIHYMDNFTRNIFILHKGSVALYRSRDSLVLNSESAPFIFGFSNQMSAPNYLFMRPQEPSLISSLPLSKANTIIEENMLWKDLAILLVYTATRIYSHCTQITQPSSYEIIKCQLIELINETAEVRQNITAASYIKSRTFLSRSGIMRILSELKTGGYINIERGLLKQINHLPDKY